MGTQVNEPFLKGDKEWHFAVYSRRELENIVWGIDLQALEIRAHQRHSAAAKTVN